MPDMCYYTRRVVEITSEISLTTHLNLRRKQMSKALKSARPVVEAIVVSIALVVVALAVPAAIVYAAV